MNTFVRTCTVVLLFTTCLAAQTAEILRGLQADRVVRVTDTSGNRTTGKWKSASDQSIAFENSKGVVSLDMANVRRVEVRSSGKRLRNIAIGAGTGVAVGAVIDNTWGTYMRNESSGDGGRALSYALSIAAGAALGALPSGWQTIYKAK